MCECITMIMFKLYIFILLYIILSGCVSNENQLTVQEEIFIDLHEIQDRPFTALFEELYYIFLKTRGEALGIITKLEMADHKILVADQQNNALYIFDLDGNLIRKIYHYGKGVGEYIKISDFYYDSENGFIVLLDRNQGKVIKYRLDGTLDSEILLPEGFYSKIYPIDQNRIALYASNERLSEYNYKIIDSHTGLVKKEMMPIDLKKSRFLNFLTFSNFYSRDDEVLTYQVADQGMVYHIDQDTILAEYQIQFGDYTIPEEVLSSEFRDVGEFVDFIQDQYVYRLSNICETDRHLLFGFHFRDAYYQCIFDKSEKEYLLFTQILNDFNADITIEDKWEVSNNAFKGTYNNKVYGYFWPDVFLIDANSKMIANQMVTDQTNPIVYIGELK